MPSESEKLFRKDIAKTLILSSGIVVFILALALYDAKNGILEAFAARFLSAILGTQM